MELRHCRYFLAVAATGNITKAAFRLNISQPTLSQQIRQLEKMLGSQLFDRMGRSIKLTAAGETLVPHARLLVDTAEHAMMEVAGSRTLEGGQLRVAFIPSLERSTSSAVNRFVAAYPKVKLNIREMPSRAIELLVQSGEIDLGIAVKRASPPDVAATILYRESYVLAFRKGHPLEGMNCRSLAAIEDRPFAMFTFGSFSRDTIDTYLSRIRFTPNVRIEAESIENLLSIVAGSDMCALLPINAVAQRDGIGHHQFNSPRPTRAVSLLSHRRGAQSPAAREFTRMIREVVSPGEA